jgi:hypothetical protein
MTENDDTTGTTGDGDLAALRAELATRLEEADAKTEVAERAAIHAHLQSALPMFEKALSDVELALEKLIDSGRFEVNVSGCWLDGEPLAVETLREAAASVSPALANARGYSGSGGHPPRPLAPQRSLESAVSDRAYWVKNRESILKRLEQEKR